jgi:ATP-dependent RNA helicase DDX27
LASLDAFLVGQVDFLLCTDLASRGLDIRGVETVINYEAPLTYEIYLHRVGRTARAGRSGRAITLCGEADRKLLKQAFKASKKAGEEIVSRLLDWDQVATFSTKLEALKEDIEDILKEEKEEKALRIAEMEVKKGENAIKHQDEIMSRPKRTWFETKNKSMAERWYAC